MGKRVGLLNYLVSRLGSARTGPAARFVMDDKKRLALWNALLANHARKAELTKQFNYATVDAALNNKAATLKVLDELGMLIPAGIVTLTDEQTTEEAVVADIAALSDRYKLDALAAEVKDAKQKRAGVATIIKELTALLTGELRLIGLLRNKLQGGASDGAKELLLQLMEMIVHNEARLYSVFSAARFAEDNAAHERVAAIARSMLLEEEVKEELERDDETFASAMLKQMQNEESKWAYRRLGEDIFHALAAKAGAPLERGTDITKGLARMERLMKDDALMRQIIKALRPKFDEAKTRGAIAAFRSAYGSGSFGELESAFAT